MMLEAEIDRKIANLRDDLTQQIADIDPRIAALKDDLIQQIENASRDLLITIKNNGLNLGTNTITASGKKLLINGSDLLVQGPPGKKGDYPGKWITHTYEKILLSKGDCIGDKAITLAMEWAKADSRISDKQYTWSYKTKDAGFDTNAIYVDFIITYFVRY